MSSGGVSSARNHSQEFTQSDWSKFCKLFWQVADKHRHIFAREEKCSLKNWTKTVGSDLNQDKKARTLL